jgi:hypothetical protein
MVADGPPQHHGYTAVALPPLTLPVHLAACNPSIPAALYPSIAHLLDPSKPRGQLEVVAVDFGCCQEVGEACIQEPHVTGTPLYMAPEDLRGCHGMEVDIWAAGVMVSGVRESVLDCWLQGCCLPRHGGGHLGSRRHGEFMYLQRDTVCNLWGEGLGSVACKDVACHGMEVDIWAAGVMVSYCVQLVGGGGGMVLGCCVQGCCSLWYGGGHLGSRRLCEGVYLQRDAVCSVWVCVDGTGCCVQECCLPWYGGGNLGSRRHGELVAVTAHTVCSVWVWGVEMGLPVPARMLLAMVWRWTSGQQVSW